MTLVELIVAIGIVAVVMGAAFTVLLTGMKTFGVNVDYSNNQSGLRAAMLQISKEER
jgi:type II secretory pathway pseudopilin PulG